jgi:hypothetical protein
LSTVILRKGFAKEPSRYMLDDMAEKERALMTIDLEDKKLLLEFKAACKVIGTDMTGVIRPYVIKTVDHIKGSKPEEFAKRLDEVQSKPQNGKKVEAEPSPIKESKQKKLK